MVAPERDDVAVAFDALQVVQQAARNNAAWCAAVCSAHGIPSRIEGDAWLSARRSPPYFPDAVTLAPGVDATQVLRHVDRAAPGCSLKDSYSDLALWAEGFEVLFDAEWVWREAFVDHESAGPWRRVTSHGHLRAWAAAWNGGDETDLFPSTLLGREGVTVLADQLGDGVTSGAVLTYADGVVGVSNLFSVHGNEDDAWRACLTAAAALYPGSRVVGYESGKSLDAAHRAGLASVGRLRVWSADPRSGT